MTDSPLVHQWIYIMIPTFNPNLPPVYFGGYCKGCGMYFTEPVPVGETILFTEGHVPREGCSGERGPDLSALNRSS